MQIFRESQQCAHLVKTMPGPVPWIPGVPESPGLPGMPVRPGRPSWPTIPGNPGRPFSPRMPGKPGSPYNPSRPGNPISPGEPVARSYQVDYFWSFFFISDNLCNLHRRSQCEVVKPLLCFHEAVTFDSQSAHFFLDFWGTSFKLWSSCPEYCSWQNMMLCWERLSTQGESISTVQSVLKRFIDV